MLGYNKLTSERSVEQIMSQTFSLYRRNFVPYFIPFLVAGALNGFVTIGVELALNQGTQAGDFSLFLGVFPSARQNFESLILSGIIGWIATTFAVGIAIKYTSNLLEQGQANLQASFNYTLRKVPYLLAATLITTILIVLGMMALIIPGIIVAIVFFLVSPAVMLEGTGFWRSFSSSCSLVSQRWQKTFGLMLITGVISLVASLIVGLISLQFVLINRFISGVLMAFITPIIPIASTLYYFSMKARALPPPPPPVPPPF